MHENGTGRTWYKLDNAAKIFPAIRSKRRTGVFRVSVILKEDIDELVLSLALKKVLPQFPSFSVSLRHGLFWYYLDHQIGYPSVKKESKYPCMRISKTQDEGFLFRVLYYQRRISIEFFHSLTDGTGALVFIKAICTEYLFQKGSPLIKRSDILNTNQATTVAGQRDDFLIYAKKYKMRLEKEKRAYSIKGSLEQPGMIHITTGIVNTQEMLNLARMANVSLTEYITAVLIEVILNHQAQNRYHRPRPVKVAIPVNLRQFFESQTLRNFSNIVNVGIDPNYGEYSFEEILKQVHYYLRYRLNTQYLGAKMTANVAIERIWWMRPLPFFVKNLFLTFGFQLFGDSRVSTIITNLGKIEVAPEISDEIERFEFLLSPVPIKPVSCAIASYQDQFVINFTRMIEESDIEKEFFRFLVKKGIHVKIKSNYNE